MRRASTIHLFLATTMLQDLSGEMQAAAVEPALAQKPADEPIWGDELIGSVDSLFQMADDGTAHSPEMAASGHCATKVDQQQQLAVAMVDTDGESTLAIELLMLPSDPESFLDGGADLAAFESKISGCGSSGGTGTGVGQEYLAECEPCGAEYMVETGLLSDFNIDVVDSQWHDQTWRISSDDGTDLSIDGVDSQWHDQARTISSDDGTSPEPDGSKLSRPCVGTPQRLRRAKSRLCAVPNRACHVSPVPTASLDMPVLSLPAADAHRMSLVKGQVRLPFPMWTLHKAGLRVQGAADGETRAPDEGLGQGTQGRPGKCQRGAGADLCRRKSERRAQAGGGQEPP